MTKRELAKKVLKAKEIIEQIQCLYVYRNDASKAKGYGNKELDMTIYYLNDYVKMVENEFIFQEVKK